MKIIFRLLLFFTALTGFGQMPVFKRYYLADFPGFGWLDKFYITYFTHYVGAMLLIAVIAFFITDYFLSHKNRFKITLSGYIRSILLMHIVGTGIFLTIKNLNHYCFPSKLITVMDLTHLVTVMLFLMFSLYTVIFRKKWIISDYEK